MHVFRSYLLKRPKPLMLRKIPDSSLATVSLELAPGPILPILQIIFGFIAPLPFHVGRRQRTRKSLPVDSMPRDRPRTDFGGTSSSNRILRLNWSSPTGPA